LILILAEFPEPMAQLIPSTLFAQPVIESVSNQDLAIAVKLRDPLAQNGFPSQKAWSSAIPIRFCSDWQAKNPDSLRQTEIRTIWSPETIFFRFEAKYRDLYTFPEQNIRHDELWTRDVAEVFIQPNSESGHTYKEIEISPNGNWLDLALNNGKGSDLNCDMKSRASIDVKEKVWRAEIAIPLQCLTRQFDPKSDWRVNFFRVEGAEPNRFYSAWHATKTPKPNFHVPEAFGVLHFSSE
jgi:alpha-galactosidase